MTGTVTGAVGAPLERIESRLKVTGQARYAFEHQEDGVLYAAIVQSPIARGRIRSIDAGAALGLDGVVAVLTHENAPRLAEVPDGELLVLQSDGIAYRGQIVAAVIAESLEAAREGERLVAFAFDAEAHDVELRAGHPRLYKPDKVNPGFQTDTERGDPEGALAAAAVAVRETYETPAFHNNPMEPHASVARWEGGDLVVWESSQGVASARDTLAKLFALDPARVRVISEHIGGGFGSKGTIRPQAVLAALAAKAAGRPVKLAVTRQQMFSITGYRTPTIQHVGLGADRDGRLSAITHDVEEQTSTVREFAEQTAVATRMMYAAPNRRTTHRLAALDVPTPSWMRAPGECPGMFALESAVDELAIALGLDPIELRVRNEPDQDPEKGIPFSSRNLVACLREGAERFGWAGRDPAPGVRRRGRWLIGTGVAASVYPTYRQPSRARVRRRGDGGFDVQVAAADIGTGARTVLTQIAADALGVGVEQVHVAIGDSDLPRASVAGGSSGTSSWGSAVVGACEALRAGGGDEAGYDTTDDIQQLEELSRHAFGAQFVEAWVDADTAEVRTPRVLGVFAAGRIVNARTARSQLIGGMTMGVGMALHEESTLDREFGDYLNHDLAQYHVPACADVADIDAAWIDEEDGHLNPMGSKGIGEIGIVGTAAAVANAVHHATGVRVRTLPIRLDRLLGRF
jgi:xanthine dehydrogenase YagR molybdenum-binding subunit